MIVINHLMNLSSIRCTWKKYIKNLYKYEHSFTQYQIDNLHSILIFKQVVACLC